MIFNEDQIRKIKQCGILGYSPDKVCLLLKIDNQEEFLIEFENKESEIRKEYDAGKLEGMTAIDIKLFNQANGGSLDAIKEMNDQNRIKKIDEIKNKLFGI